MESGIPGGSLNQQAGIGTQGLDDRRWYSLMQSSDNHEGGVKTMLQVIQSPIIPNCIKSEERESKIVLYAANV